MTAARQLQKHRLALAVFGRAAQAGLAFGVLALGMSGNLSVLRAATTERVVVDWHTGLAIAGYDPVAYFTDGRAMVGRGEFEFRHAGAVWRFRNAGNRDAFAARPDVYTPQFGGYDPVSAARGVAVAGNPLVWSVLGERLYLFYNEAARGSFGGHAGRVLAAAERKWPGILASLTP
jgi:hypothetical protein